MCGDQTIDLQDELIGWFLYGLGFCRGYFQVDYSIVLIPEAAIANCPFIFITAVMSYGGYLDFEPVVYLRAPLWMFL